MPKRLALAVVVAMAATVSTTQAETKLNIVPHGQVGPGVPFASTPGLLPADTQARMYDRLTPLFRNVTDAQLVPSTDGTGFFKSAALLAEDDPSFISSQTVGSGDTTATIKRDPYGVPHIYSPTDKGATFAAGYVVASDQGLLLNQARTNGVAGLLDIPGVPAIRLILGLYNFTPTQAVLDEATALQTKNILAQGAQGKQLLADIDTYVAGINARLADAGGYTAPFTRTDIYALNAVKAQFLGEGGGGEVGNAQFLESLRRKLGPKRGDGVFRDLQARNDPETSVTTPKSFPAQTNVPIAKPKGMVRLKNNSFESSAIALPGGRRFSADDLQRQQASNILMVSGKRSATGAPLFVGGPQIGYNYPGLTLEMQIKSPSINVRGVSSAPFPGYMLIGNGPDYAWSLTSAGADIIDTYAETLCGGSDTKYRFKGKCRSMETVDAGTITQGEAEVAATFRRTVHGPVVGYATDKATGKRVALARKRSSYGRETVDLLFNQDLTFGRVKNAADFIDAAEKTPQTFNSFYANKTQTTFYTAGRIPTRPKGVNPTLPVRGTGDFEWKGVLPAADHPQTTNPSSGLIVNWNNKPARDFPAGDDRFGSEGGIQRNTLLLGELQRFPKATLANVLGVANAGATEDVRIARFWPTLKAMLAKAKAPDAQSAQLASILDEWNKQGASRVDSDLDGTIDSPGAPIIDAAWDGLANAAMCGRLGKAVCDQLSGLISRYDTPPGGQYAGWHQYMDKDFRTILGRKVKGRYSTTYCGNGKAAKCAASLWKALSAAGKKLAAEQGADPSAFRSPTTKIQFSPLPLFEMQYTNRPSGIHQVMTFKP